MNESAEQVNELSSPDGSIHIRIGSKILILEETGWTSKKLKYPFEGIVTKLVAEWDNDSRYYLTEDWGPNMITLGKHTFYPNKDFSNIKVLIF